MVNNMSLSENETKTCPYCAENIKIGAVICRYCKKELLNNDEVIEKVSCKTYSVKILPTTAALYSGNCSPCARSAVGWHQDPSPRVIISAAYK
jgi:hypothetical protein